MVWTYVTLENHNVMALADLSDQLPHPASNLIPQHRLAVFGDEDEMVMQTVWEPLR